MPRKPSGRTRRSPKPASKDNQARPARTGAAKSSGHGITAKVFDVLEALAKSPSPMTIPELIKACRLTTPTAHRVTRMLTDLELVSRDSERRFCEGPRLLELAFAAIMGSTQRGARSLLLSELAARINETCHLFSLSGAEVVLIDVAHGANAVGIRLERGTRLPVYATAPGKVLLAALAGPARDRLLTSLNLHAFTARTVTSLAALAEQVAKAEKDGYAVSDGEAISDIAAIAVPVASKKGKVIAALTVATPRARRGAKQLTAFLSEIRDTAARIGNSY